MNFTDEEIKRDVVDQLFWDGRVDASHIAVEVKDGKVILSGTVPTYHSMLSAIRDAREMPGVTAVENMVKIQQADIENAPDDEVILASLENRFFLNPDIDVSQVDISVENGEVTLTGTVKALWLKLHIEELVSQENGVTGIRNELAVVPTEVYPDEDLAKAVVASLERSALVEPSQVTVTVRHGVVTMRGTVSNWAARENAYQSAVNIPGVVDVVSEISLQRD